jgi:hypothetical protein
MAVSETARLIASLELQDKFSGTSNKALGQLGKLEVVSGKASKGMGLFGHAISTALGVGLERAASGGIRLLVGAVTGGIESLSKLDDSVTQTNAVLASTKGVSGQTADSVRTMAESFEDLNAQVGDEFIQAGENMLLTFTNLRGKAFKPATQAILDMNTAMGNGPEGLTNTAILVGKALNDPIRGATALRRVGVTLTKQQEDQIKTLVKQNDLYGAQQIILKELGTEFGGSFAAAGKTAAGQQAALRDSVEDLQRVLAKGLLPGLTRVRAGLTEAFRDPATIAAVTKFGDQIAGFLSAENIRAAIGIVRGAFQSLADVPWGAIGEGLKIAGQATKIAVEAFKSLPGPLQGALIASLAVNKLSGGIVGSLGKGVAGAAGGGIAQAIGKLFGGRGSSPAAPLFTKEVGIPGVPGGGVPTPGGAGGGLLATAAKWVLGPAAAVVIGAEIAKAINDPLIQPTKTAEQTKFTAAIDSKDVARQTQAFNALNSELKSLGSNYLGQIILGTSSLPIIGDAIGNVGPELIKQRQIASDILAGVREDTGTLKSEQADLRAHNAARAREAAQLLANTKAAQAAVGTGLREIAGVVRQTSSQIVAAQRATTARQSAIQAAIDRGRVVTGAGLQRLAEKNFSPTVRVSVSSIANISVSSVVRATTSFHIATGGTGGLIEGASY